jgi:cell wall-associated NlpC family hydrolase
MMPRMPLKRYSLPRLISGSRQIWAFLILAILTTACARTFNVSHEKPTDQKKYLPKMGYSIQVGAFSKVENAICLTDSLQAQGMGAYYFFDKSGLYKVRFGNLPSREAALDKAKALYKGGIIDDYYIIAPYDYSLEQRLKGGGDGLREDIVSSAKNFIGIPYKWGESSPNEGFDCSGFTMAVYQLNGLNLPRSSREQWKVGEPVDRKELSKADLVFFSTSGNSEVTHVGIYVGKNRFIHAPAKGKNITMESLSDQYYENAYVGARSYL